MVRTRALSGIKKFNNSIFVGVRNIGLHFLYPVYRKNDYQEMPGENDVYGYST